MIEVTQADREASVSLFVWLFQDGHSLEPFTAKDHMGGERDDHIILRTLATHRIEAAKAERDRLRELPDDVLARVNVFRDEIDDSDLRAIATALADALESQP